MCGDGRCPFTIYVGTDSLRCAPGTSIIIQCHTSITSQFKKKKKQCVICYTVFFLPWQLLKHQAEPQATSILSETDIELRSPANAWCTCGLSEKYSFVVLSHGDWQRCCLLPQHNPIHADSYRNEVTSHLTMLL